MRITVGEKETGERLDRFLVKHVPNLSAARARTLIEEGAVVIRGKPCSHLRKLWRGDVVDIRLPEDPADIRVVVPDVPILHASDDVVVVDKPAGLDVAAVVAQLSKQLGSDVNAPHRMDVQTSGCLPTARTNAGAEVLAGHMERSFTTLVLGQPPDTQRLESTYGRHPDTPRLYTTRVSTHRRASLSFCVKERFSDVALLELQLHTPRSHLILVQLADTGFPVLGDDVYGSEASRINPAAVLLGRHALHAHRTLLRLPTGPVDVISPLPADFQAALTLLRRPLSQ